MSAIEIVANSAQVHVTWALSILGGSIATILGTSYLSPQTRRLRSWYLLFIPGWGLLGVSIYFGDLIARRYIAAQFVSKEKIPDIARAMNLDYLIQQWTLLIAVSILVLWLIGYLLWWIYLRTQDERVGG